MGFERRPGPGGPPGGTRWMVRLFETADQLAEHLNRSNLRPDQVKSVMMDQDGFYVLVYYVGGERPPPPPREERFERPAPPRRRFEDEDEGGRGERPFRGGGRSFDRSAPRRSFPPRRSTRG